MAQQLGPVIERATSPSQIALPTRSSTECIAHAIQAFTDLDPTTTVVSIDGIGAFDDSTLPFVLQFCGSASSYLWDNQEGTVHTILSEAIPSCLLFSPSASTQLLERVFAFLDDVYVVCSPPRVNAIYGLLTHS